MTTTPYELLARFKADGTVAGVSVRTLTTVNGRAREDDPEPLSDATDPAFVAFAETFSAAVVAERDALAVERDALAATVETLTTERDAAIANEEAMQARIDELEAELDAVLNPPAVTSITRRQGRLALLAAGLLADVEAMVVQSGAEAQINYDAATWYRSDPVLNQMAAALGMTEEQLDNLFLLASSL